MNTALKQQAARAALAYIKPDIILGVGTGSTVNYFIEALAHAKIAIKACVASSLITEQRLKQANISIIGLNQVDTIPIYIDGADEVDSNYQMIKGGGGAHTKEKLVASIAQRFICIVDQTKVVKKLGTFPIAVEVLPEARNYASRMLVKLGGNPVYRADFVTDSGNNILDVYNLPLENSLKMESDINNINGVVAHGLFVQQKATQVIVAEKTGVRVF